MTAYSTPWRATDYQFLPEPRLAITQVGRSFDRPGEYHQRFAAGVTDRQARRDLVELAEAGFLLRTDKGGGTICQTRPE